jgi:hypothetical protein
MKLAFYSLGTLILIAPVFVFAQGKVYSPLVNIPSQGNQQMSFEAYINFLYGMSISIAALLAVVKIVIAGAKYMLSDVISKKGEAISDIQGAILGLLLIISAVVILELINPNLTARAITFPELQSRKPTPAPVTPANPGGQPGQVGGRAVTAPEFPIDNYGSVAGEDLDERYSTISNGLVVYDVKAHCDTTSNPSACVKDIELAMFDTTAVGSGFCVHNAGVKKNQSPTTFACQLPSFVKTQAEIRAEYDKNKAYNNTVPFDENIYRKLCAEWGGNFVDIKTYKYSGMDDYRCVKY